MLLLRLGEAGSLLDAESDLGGLVAVLLQSLELNDRAGTDLDDGHAGALAVGVVDLGHSDFLTDQTFHDTLLSDLDGDVDASGKIELLELIDRLSGRVDDVEKALMRAHLELIH